MNRIFANSFLVLLGGCVQITVPPSDSDAGRSTTNPSPLTPGIYFGTEVCEVEARANGGTATTTEEFDLTLIIGESGIPVRNGEEEYEGRTDVAVRAGIEFLMTVTDVTVMADGVSVLALGGATSSDATADFRELDVYTPVNNGDILVTSDLSIGGSSGSQSVSSTGTCRGVYSR
ncbi:MAG: hypothetical protein JSU63_17750 [Phycisphaerales bacterium]|nr:MAG: hypothetical protein JSU63_17750 [Phycisphaerales bacterium]